MRHAEFVALSHERRVPVAPLQVQAVVLRLLHGAVLAGAVVPEQWREAQPDVVCQIATRVRQTTVVKSVGIRAMGPGAGITSRIACQNPDLIRRLIVPHWADRLNAIIDKAARRDLETDLQTVRATIAGWELVGSASEPHSL